MEPTDIELLTLYQQSPDDSAFAALVDRHRSWIYAAARRRLHDDHDAEDVVQAVFIVLADKTAQLIQSNHMSISAWLFHVMHFACTRMRRTQVRKTAGLAGAAGTRNKTDQESPDSDLLILMEDSICELPVADRELIIRRFYRRESFVQIGESLNITADAARKRVGRVLLDIQSLMVRDGADAIPEAFLNGLKQTSPTAVDSGRAVIHHKRIDDIVKGTVAMVEEQKASEFPVVSAEFFVKDVEANIAFFEKLGFRRRYVEAVDAMGRIPRASLVAGVSRIWLRRADESEGTRPAPGVCLYFWIDGGAEGLIAHRKRVADEGVTVSSFVDDISLRNFTVATPDGYKIGFFTQYRDVPP